MLDKLNYIFKGLVLSKKQKDTFKEIINDKVIRIYHKNNNDIIIDDIVVPKSDVYNNHEVNNLNINNTKVFKYIHDRLLKNYIIQYIYMITVFVK